ncbi:MAG TPA: hypothetical protein PLI09_23050 [Candidatus Hydrogenedentes bacterium]|nr:hypothetical protein [Candidatus Hydrogenedentota bacterium]
MNTSEPSIITADDAVIVRMVLAAQVRLIAMAPAFSQIVAQAISDKWKLMGRESVNVILDADAGVYRLGYGVPGGLDLLSATARELKTTLNRQPGIRIGIIISDNDTLIYTPTPLLIEAGHKETPAPLLTEAGRKETPAPNAIHLPSAPPSIERDLGQGPEGATKQTIGLDPIEKDVIKEVKSDLEKNPPQKFDVARQIHVFNSYFEFVELSIEGTQIDRKKVSIPPYLLGVVDAKTKNQLHASFNLVPETDEMSGKHIDDDRKKIVKQYLKVIPNYGTVILRADKEKFQKQIKELEQAVEDFRKALVARLQTSTEKSRLMLMEELLPRLNENPPKEWRTSFQSTLDPSTVSHLLDEELKDAFGQVEQMIRGMGIKCLFKGVTYEMLQDKNFVTAVKKVLPDLPVFHEEYTAARVVK